MNPIENLTNLTTDKVKEETCVPVPESRTDFTWGALDCWDIDYWDEAGWEV